MSNKSVSDYYNSKKRREKPITIEEDNDIPPCIEIPASGTQEGHFLIPVGSIKGHTLWLGFESHSECVGSGLAEGLRFEE